MTVTEVSHPSVDDRTADQNERDHRDFVKAIKSGHLKAVEGV